MPKRAMTPNQYSAAFTAAGCCQHCGAVCILPDHDPRDLFWETGSRNRDILARPRRYRIRVVHLNGRRDDDSIRNLKALCIRCALKFYARFRKRPVHRRRSRY